MAATRFASLSIVAALLSIAATAAPAFDPAKDLESLNKELRETQVIMDKCPGPLKVRIPCIKKLSNAGNSAATSTLAELYADPMHYEEESGLTKNPQESIRLAILAIKQGSYHALTFIPPKPYKWQIGMSGAQVRESVDGEPERIVPSETETVYVETWIYPHANLMFARSPVRSKLVVLKAINEVK